MKTKEFRGNKGIVELGPILPVTTPEMRALWNKYAEENPQDFPLTRWDYVDKFQKWYDNLEVQSKIWIDNLHSGQDSYRDKHLHPRIKRKVESIVDGRFILDIGCGTGEAVIPHLKSSQHYLGLDISRHALEYAGNKFEIPLVDDEMFPNYNRDRMLRFGGLPNTIPLKNGRVFDEVIASMMLHHVNNLEGSVQTITDTLFPGGGYFIVTFDSDRREEIDGFFDKIHYQDERTTVGDYNLPQGKLSNVRINFHGNQEVFDELKKHSDYVRHEENAGIFSIFEGIKKRK